MLKWFRNMASGMIDRVNMVSSFSTFSPESKEPVWYQGKCITPDGAEGWQPLADEFARSPWITYRNHFPAIGSSTHTSDGGWGCMIRSGQMMLARAIIRHRLGRDWEISKGAEEVRKVLSLFLDVAGGQAPYSIHNICLVGQQDLDKNIGEWFGPNTVTTALEKLHRKYCGARPEFGFYVANDAMLYLDSVTKAMEEGGGSLVVWIPLRLGIDRINEVYLPGLTSMFKTPQCCGIIGGIGKHSLYLVSMQGDQCMFLDPHTVQKAVEPGQLWSLESFSCPVIQKTPLSSIDPSLCIGFYLRNKDDLDDLVGRLAELKQTCQQLFYVEKSPPETRVHTNDPGADEDDIIEF